MNERSKDKSEFLKRHLQRIEQARRPKDENRQLMDRLEASRQEFASKDAKATRLKEEAHHEKARVDASKEEVLRLAWKLEANSESRKEGESLCEQVCRLTEEREATAWLKEELETASKNLKAERDLVSSVKWELGVEQIKVKDLDSVLKRVQDSVKDWHLALW